MHRRIPGLILAASTLLIIAGCSGSPTPSPSPSPRTEGLEAPSEERLEQTLWSIGDDPDEQGGDALADDDPDVQAVRKAAALYTQIVDTRSWNTLSQSLSDEKSFYSEAAVAELGPDYDMKLEALYVPNSLTVQPVSVSWLRSTIDDTRTSAVAAMRSTFMFTEAAQSFLDERQLTLGASYIESRRIYFSKIDGTWLIDKVERAPLAPVGSSAQ